MGSFRHLQPLIGTAECIQDGGGRQRGNKTEIACSGGGEKEKKKKHKRPNRREAITEKENVSTFVKQGRRAGPHSLTWRWPGCLIHSACPLHPSVMTVVVEEVEVDVLHVVVVVVV